MEMNGGVYVKGEESAIKGGRRIPNVKCKSQGEDKVVVVGGYVRPRPCLSNNCRTRALLVSSILKRIKFSHPCIRNPELTYSHSGSGAFGAVQKLRELGFKGSVTM